MAMLKRAQLFASVYIWCRPYTFKTEKKYESTDEQAQTANPKKTTWQRTLIKEFFLWHLYYFVQFIPSIAISLIYCPV
jgi:hypothetical protein